MAFAQEFPVTDRLSFFLGCRACGAAALVALAWAASASAQEAPAEPPPAQPPAAQPPDGEQPAAEPAPEPPPRQKYIDEPGAPRQALPNFRTARKLEYKEPTPKLRKAFDDMSSGAAKVDPPIIDAMAKFLVYRMTDPGRESDLSALADDALRPINTALGTTATGNLEPFVAAYKKALTKYAADLMGNAVVVRINAVRLVRDLIDGTADARESSELLLEVYDQSEQNDGVRYQLLDAFDEIVSNPRTPLALEVNDRSRIAARSMRIVRDQDMQALLAEQMARTLGTLGRPYSGNVPAQADVATWLARIVLDPQSKVRTRYEAAVALGRMDIRLVPEWNHEIVLMLLARQFQDLVDHRDAGEIGEDRFKHLVFGALQAMVETARRIKDSPQLTAELADLVQVTLASGKRVLEDGPAEFSQTNEWLEKNPKPVDLRMAGGAEELVWPDLNAPAADAPAPAAEPAEPAGG